uniref:Beta-myrcene synthase n=1 Tax=Tanacetum cinerariifolium TaxID=118510 RepID=A0A699HSZ0_TANCI|nr:beta-myrcene synthase [Tanacetum cinerariifolium]
MNHRQFRSVLCYRLAIPMFSEGSLCLSCSAHRMDRWGDHDVHCSSKVGVKFRHNLDDRKDLRPADLLLFNWLQGKDAYLDVTCISPFAGIGATSCAHGVALNNVMEKKKESFDYECLSYDYLIDAKEDIVDKDWCH